LSHEYIPDWEVTDQLFTCFPVIGVAGAQTIETVGPDDLALAAKGATVTADSELDLDNVPSRPLTASFPRPAIMKANAGILR
jgi:hypothetical protein